MPYYSTLLLHINERTKSYVTDYALDLLLSYWTQILQNVKTVINFYQTYKLNVLLMVKHDIKNIINHTPSQNTCTKFYYTHADSQGVDISFTVCFLCVWVCVCMGTDFSTEDRPLMLAASNFARLFIGILGRESPILGTLLCRKSKIGWIGHQRQVLPIHASLLHWWRACVAHPGMPLACVDIRPSPKTDVLVFKKSTYMISYNL